MKHFIMVVGMMGFLWFGVNACSEAPDSKDAGKVAKPEVEKTMAVPAETEQIHQQAVEKTGNISKTGSESATQAPVEDVDAAKNAPAEPVKPSSPAPVPATKADDAAGMIEMKHTDAFSQHKMGIVIFTHQKHTDAAPDGHGVACGECHHDKDGKPLALKTGDAVQACMECHDKTEKPKKPEGIAKKDWDAMQLEYFYGAIHANCIDCHKAGGAGPVKCAECHPKLEK